MKRLLKEVNASSAFKSIDTETGEMFEILFMYSPERTRKQFLVMLLTLELSRMIGDGEVNPDKRMTKWMQKHEGSLRRKE